jgi:hypothetical protein
MERGRKPEKPKTPKEEDKVAPPIIPTDDDSSPADIIISAGKIGRYTVTGKDENNDSVIRLSANNKDYVCYCKKANPYDKVRKDLLKKCITEDSFARDDIFAVVYKEYRVPKLTVLRNILKHLIDLMETVSKMHSNKIVHACLDENSIRISRRKNGNPEAKIQNHTLLFKIGDSPDDVPAEALTQGTAYDIACIGAYIASAIEGKEGEAFEELKSLAQEMSSEDPEARPTAQEALDRLNAIRREFA